jgi:hypothetical protein
MSLARAWTRQLYGATGVSLLAATAIVGALLALGLSGGFGALGSLGQAFAGPSLPASARTAGGTAPGTGGASAKPLPIAAASVPAAAGAAVAGAGGARRAPGRGAGRAGGGAGARTVGATGPVRATGGGGAGGTSVGTGTGGGTGGGGGGGGGSSLIGNVVNLATSVTKQIPGPVGSTATQLLQSIGKSLEQVVPLSAAASSLTGAVNRLTSGLHLP